MRLRLLLSAALLLGAVSTMAQAQGFTLLTMDEVPNQPIPVGGLTVKNITFSCNVAGCASYNAPNGGVEAFVQDPSIEGITAGTVLTITLGNPTTHLQFGVALSTFGPVTAGMVVQLKDTSNANIGGPISVNTQSLVNFTEGFFSANTEGRLIGSAVVTFNAGAASAFAIDNLGVTPFDKFLRFFY